MTGTNDGGKRGGRSELAAALVRLRLTAGLDQTGLAGKLGRSQSQVSRIEQDRRLPTVEEVEAWCTITGASPDDREHAVELAQQARGVHRNARAVFQRGGAKFFQERVEAQERAARHVRAYQPGMVLGVLQTVDYAAAVFGGAPDLTPDEAAALVASRRARHASIQAEPLRRWTLIQTVGAFTYPLLDAAGMVSQVEQVIETSREPNVELGIIGPTADGLRVTAPHGFHVYDADAVQVGTKSGTQLTSDQEFLDIYRGLFDKLAARAVFGDEAREVLARIAAEYRTLT